MSRTVLITGVSSGIGRLTCELMRRKGWQVAGTSRNPTTLSAWAQQTGVKLFPLDLSDEASIAQTVPAAVEQLGRLDVLVNNAGYGVMGPVEGCAPEQIEAQFRINVLGAISLIRHVMPVMRKQGGGTIVNVSSIGGRMASPFASLYHATKYAIEGFSDAFRHEAALHGVRIKLVEPAHFKTGFFDRSLVLTEHPDYKAQLDNYLQWVRLEDEKSPTAEPVAEMILRAAEDTSARLRYPVKGKLILALTRLLPDAVWRSLLAGGMTRRPKKTAAQSWGDAP